MAVPNQEPPSHKKWIMGDRRSRETQKSHKEYLEALVNSKQLKIKFGSLQIYIRQNRPEMDKMSRNFTGVTSRKNKVTSNTMNKK